jgi:hypothetical protein
MEKYVTSKLIFYCLTKLVKTDSSTIQKNRQTIELETHRTW